MVSHEVLLERVWDEYADPFTNAVRVPTTPPGSLGCRLTALGAVALALGERDWLPAAATRLSLKSPGR